MAFFDTITWEGSATLLAVVGWLCLAALFVAIMERLEEPVKFQDSIFRKLRPTYWLKTESWVRKYKRDMTGSPVILGYDKRGKLKYKRRFPGSTTWLVFLTDAWHLAKWCAWSCIVLAVLSGMEVPALTWKWLGLFVCLKGLFGGVFEIFYTDLLRARS